MKSVPEIIGISTGDINGIGIELILKSFEDKRMFEICTPVVYASNRIFSYYKKNLKIEIPVSGITEPSKAQPGKINIINITKEEYKITPGKPSESSGKFAALSLEKAVDDLKKGIINILVTAPIDKQNIQSESFKFPGHTEYLSDTFQSDVLMMLIQEELRVALLTGHTPLNLVSQTITRDLIHKTVQTLHHSLIQDFRISKPKIALLGINPHAGDKGLIGSEENEVISPAIEELRREDYLVFGPYPADGFFGSGSYMKFDAVIAAYHDQGLAPFKALSFGKGVNFTAGLPIVRTSPDHGTAFDIAGQGIANPSSFKEAIYKALDINRIRREYLNLSNR